MERPLFEGDMAIGVVEAREAEISSGGSNSTTQEGVKLAKDAETREDGKTRISSRR